MEVCYEKDVVDTFRFPIAVLRQHLCDRNTASGGKAGGSSARSVLRFVVGDHHNHHDNGGNGHSLPLE